jgi:mannose-6-phosphate isomerase
MSPRRLSPSLREKVWGSTRLEPWFPNSQHKIGEIWFEGADQLPLLVKFLFTSEKLSVQVHPGDAYARAHHNSRGKTEMWHILAAEPGAQIAAGFKDTLSAEQLRAAALSGEIENLLQWFDAAPGDTFFIPAGTVHAIGAGLALCEIQQHSDVTYRLYDYGRPRELHLDHALAVSHRGPYAARQVPSGDLLVSCEYFTTERRHVETATLYQPLEDQAQVLIAIEGKGLIAGQPMKAGDAWYARAGALAFELSGAVTFLQTFDPSANAISP